MLGLILFLLLAQPEETAISDGLVTCQTAVRFSPKGGIEDLLIKEIGLAKERIRIAIYGLNNSKIVNALIAASASGVNVALKLDKAQSSGKNQKLQIARLHKAGIKVEISQLSRLLHNKFMVVDAKKVWTGSYNWTTQAENQHRENIVLLNCPEVADLFEREWVLIEIEN